MTAYLRKVGGSHMLTVPQSVVSALHVQAGAPFDIEVEGNRIVATALRRPRYTLAELLSQCDPTAPRSTEDQEWLDGEPVGDEII